MLEKILPSEQCVLDNQSKSKQALLKSISELLSISHDHINCHDILQGLLEREKLGTTSIGHGVALPHARLDKINSPIASLVKLNQAIDFDAEDPVDLVFTLIVPTDIQETHLTLLANIANIFNDEQRRVQLRKAMDANTLWRTLLDFDHAVNHNNV